MFSYNNKPYNRYNDSRNTQIPLEEIYASVFMDAVHYHARS